MSKKVTIPTCMDPFIVMVNGVKYSYPAGQEVEVPDDIAQVIERHNATHKKNPDGTVAPHGGNVGVSSWNDLTDRPFGESENAVLLPPTQFAFDSTFGLFAVPGYIDFVVGKTYTVNWNGVDYTTEGVPGQFNGANLVVLGNPAALGGANNNLPFAVACLMGAIGAIPLDGSTAVNVGITGYAITKIPVQYMPRMIVYVETAAEVHNPNYGDLVYGDDKLTILTPGVKWTDIYAAVVSDIEVIIRVQNKGETNYVNYHPNWVRKDSVVVNFYAFGKNDYIMIVDNSSIYTKLT